jgi:hypothetical protein
LNGDLFIHKDIAVSLDLDRDVKIRDAFLRRNAKRRKRDDNKDQKAFQHRYRSMDTEGVARSPSLA